MGFAVNYFPVISVLTGSTIDQIESSKHLETMEQLQPASRIDGVLHSDRPKLMNKFAVDCPMGPLRLHVSCECFVT